VKEWLSDPECSANVAVNFWWKYQLTDAERNVLSARSLQSLRQQVTGSIVMSMMARARQARAKQKRSVKPT